MAKTYISIYRPIYYPPMDRTDKGPSLLVFFPEYTAIDLETTGFYVGMDRIIEMGAAHVKDGIIVDTFSTLIDIHDPIPDHITAKTGITEEMIKGQASEMDALEQFLAFSGERPIVGHNVSFDINFIYDDCQRLFNKPFTNSCADTMRISRHLFPGLERHRLDDLVSHFAITTKNTHRALPDCLSALECYEHMRNYCIDNSIDLEELCRKKQKRWGSKQYHHLNINIAELQPESTDFDTTTEVYGQVFVFTGTLSKLSRKEAMQDVINMGGKVSNGLTQKTNYLVMGERDYSRFESKKSRKQLKAEELMGRGFDLKIISEQDFTEMLMSE